MVRPAPDFKVRSHPVPLPPLLAPQYPPANQPAAAPPPPPLPTSWRGCEPPPPPPPKSASETEQAAQATSAGDTGGSSSSAADTGGSSSSAADGSSAVSASHVAVGACSWSPSCSASAAPEQTAAQAHSSFARPETGDAGGGDGGGSDEEDPWYDICEREAAVGAREIEREEAVRAREMEAREFLLSMNMGSYTSCGKSSNAQAAAPAQGSQEQQAAAHAGGQPRPAGWRQGWQTAEQARPDARKLPFSPKGKGGSAERAAPAHPTAQQLPQQHAQPAAGPPPQSGTLGHPPQSSKGKGQSNMQAEQHTTDAASALEDVPDGYWDQWGYEDEGHD